MNRLNNAFYKEHNDYRCMKKYIKYLFLCLFAFLIACEDNWEQYWDDYSTILYFRNSGEIECPLYKPEETTPYAIAIVKAGTNQEISTSVDLSLMNENMLAEYNNIYGTHYKVLPTNCYDFETGRINFNSTDMYKKLDMTFYTDPVNALQTGNEETEYVVPLFLSNSADSINAEKQYMFIKPTVVTPVVSFEKNGYIMNSFSETGDAQMELKLPLAFSIENKWDFDCYTEVDETLLETYNQEMGVNYLMLPDVSYTIANEGVVKMSPEDDNNLHVTVKREGLSFGNYALPLLLTRTSSESIEIDLAKNSCLLGVSYVPDASNLQQVQLTESMISYHPNSICEGSVADLIDGNPDNYYHSDYSVGVPLPHWLQFALPKECSAFRFEYITRDKGAHVVPSTISLHGSEDGNNFIKLMTIDTGLPSDVGQTYTSPVLVTGKSIKHIRFSVDNSPSGSFALAEFRLWTL